jgi:hypothetical protein
MRTGHFSLSGLTLLAVTFFFLGCGSDSADTPVQKVGGAPPQSASATDHSDHEDHGDHEGHDHGDAAAQEHPTEGPHGGHLIELGNEEYHAELLHDENTHTVAIHLLDATGKQPVPISSSEITVQLFQGGQFVKYALKGVESPGDPTAAVSQFQIVDAALCDALSHEQEIKGRLQVTIDGKPYTGTIQHSSHGDHDHEGHDHAGHEH